MTISHSDVKTIPLPKVPPKHDPSHFYVASAFRRPVLLSHFPSAHLSLCLFLSLSDLHFLPFDRLSFQALPFFFSTVKPYFFFLLCILVCFSFQVSFKTAALQREEEKAEFRECRLLRVSLPTSESRQREQMTPLSGRKR